MLLHRVSRIDLGISHVPLFKISNKFLLYTFQINNFTTDRQRMLGPLHCWKHTYQHIYIQRETDIRCCPYVQRPHDNSPIRRYRQIRLYAQSAHFAIKIIALYIYTDICIVLLSSAGSALDSPPETGNNFSSPLEQFKLIIIIYNNL
eukprot:GHVU01118596.1.p1 GENE.GHVU01118596.1~~GHVU01118596.1.p1  ORF type:complete len:147 (-),score=5.59 GHVU01118596.1:55-495(-)